MLSYKDFTKHFGLSLFDKCFQIFLAESFSDLTEYNVLKNDYIISEKYGIELGFTNSSAIYDDDDNVVFEKGNPVFSHFNLNAKSLTLIDSLPFDTNFGDKRVNILNKAGTPSQTKQGYADFLNKHFLVDNYKVEDIVISFDFDPEKQILNGIHLRDNNLVEHLKL